MKKVVKWTIYILVLAAVLTAIVCYIAFPAETRQVIDKVMQYANTPIVIAGVSTTVGFVLVYIIVKYVLSNTKFGRRELDSIKSDMVDFKNETTDSIKEYEGKFGELENGFKDLKSEAENKVTVVYNEFSDLQEMVLASLESFPNKNIQQLAAQYREEFDKRKKEIVDKTINTNEFIDKKIAEIRGEYEKMFNGLLAKVESTLNEEAKND